MAMALPALIAAGSTAGASSAVAGGLLAAGSAGIPLGGFAAASSLAGAAGSFGSLLSTVGTLGSVFGSLASGSQQSQSFKFQQAQAKMQSRQFEIEALQNSNEIKRRMLSDLASANAGYASRGVSTSSGTPQQAATEAIRVANRNVSIAQNNGAMNSSLSNLQAGQYGSAAGSAYNTGLFTSLSKIAGQA